MEWFNQPGHPPGIIVKPICLDNFKPYPPDQTNPEFTIIGSDVVRDPKPVEDDPDIVIPEPDK